MKLIGKLQLVGLDASREKERGWRYFVTLEGGIKIEVEESAYRDAEAAFRAGLHEVSLSVSGAPPAAGALLGRKP